MCWYETGRRQVNNVKRIELRAIVNAMLLLLLLLFKVVEFGDITIKLNIHVHY